MTAGGGGLGDARSTLACVACGSLAWGGATCLQGTAAAPGDWGVGERRISTVEGMDGARGWEGLDNSTGVDTLMGLWSGLWEQQQRVSIDNAGCFC